MKFNKLIQNVARSVTGVEYNLLINACCADHRHMRQVLVSREDS